MTPQSLENPCKLWWVPENWVSVMWSGCCLSVSAGTLSYWAPWRRNKKWNSSRTQPPPQARCCEHSCVALWTRVL
eukprot:scaffold19_cov447-Pavlova_lutheri.AAC.1